MFPRALITLPSHERASGKEWSLGLKITALNTWSGYHPREVEEQGVAAVGRTDLHHLALHHDLLADVVLRLLRGVMTGA